MELNEVLKKIKTTFTLHKRVDFDDYDLHIEMEPLTTQEELKVLEACTDLEGAAYLEGLKKHSLAFAIKKITTGGKDLDLNENEFKYVDDDGMEKSMSKYLMLVEQIGEWPASLRDLIFEAFNDLQQELESKIREKGKFERFLVNEPPSEEETVPSGMRRVKEAKEDAEMTDAEKLTRTVEKEMDTAQDQMDRTNTAAETETLRNG